MKHLKLFENFINESDSITLAQIAKLDKWMMHDCKDKQLQNTYEEAVDELFANLTVNNWSEAIKKDDTMVQSILDQYGNAAMEHGFSFTNKSVV